jgi:DNA polymerase-3 subunit alpha
MVRGTVKQRFNSDYYEFKVTQIELLSEVRKTYIKSITLNLPIHKINRTVIEGIDTLAKNNKGKTLLKFNVYDEENNMNIQMFSRTTKINLSDNFLNFFEKELDITYRIN